MIYSTHGSIQHGKLSLKTLYTALAPTLLLQLFCVVDRTHAGNDVVSFVLLFPALPPSLRLMAAKASDRPVGRQWLPLWFSKWSAHCSRRLRSSRFVQRPAKLDSSVAMGSTSAFVVLCPWTATKGSCFAAKHAARTGWYENCSSAGGIALDASTWEDSQHVAVAEYQGS